ncbi:unnamed protein product [Arctia plantaginis]|uniref:Uncharacterized protein n=1 Tax=Arctia plantaginis TaxID=874455 RepID=A0A8S1BTC4_ARCPL|nr:unnamed protein product [Arctia plantaginis]
MTRSEDMLRLALKNDIINITFKRDTITENLPSSNNTQISINEQCEGWDNRNASELSDVIVESENNKTGSSYSNYSSSSSSDSSNSR